jgi:hypothetical protein
MPDAPAGHARARSPAVVPNARPAPRNERRLVTEEDVVVLPADL